MVKGHPPPLKTLCHITKVNVCIHITPYNSCPIPPILLCQLLDGDRLVGRGLLLHLVLVVLLADDLEVDLVLPGNIPLLLEQYCRIPERLFKLGEIQSTRLNSFNLICNSKLQRNNLCNLWPQKQRRTINFSADLFEKNVVRLIKLISVATLKKSTLLK